MQNSYQSRTIPATLTQTDPQLAALLAEEETRQRFKIRLIASENYVSSAVREACDLLLQANGHYTALLTPYLPPAAQGTQP